KMTTPDSVKQNMGFGIIPTMQFLVHIFQTPPEITSNISLKKAEIISFKEAETNKSDTAKSMIITAQNIGEVILDCVSYIEITNLQTGENQRLKPTPFTLLPNNTREIYIKIPGNLKKGKYSLLGVLDYRGKEVQAAEYDLEIK
ncbi:MAG: hypothetical protein Q8880_02595, partial [Bacteroidota bacterium]|nr:hypothetical protein [Bacteroidota bacterium]